MLETRNIFKTFAQLCMTINYILQVSSAGGLKSINYPFIALLPAAYWHVII